MIVTATVFLKPGAPPVPARSPRLQPTLTVSATTNRITTSPYAYDANGNMTEDANSNIYVYDAENRTANSFV
jgi:hypothetical protein